MPVLAGERVPATAVRRCQRRVVRVHREYRTTRRAVRCGGCAWLVALHEVHKPFGPWHWTMALDHVDGPWQLDNRTVIYTYAYIDTDVAGLPHLL